MQQVIFDTNIYISAFHFGGIPKQLLHYAIAGKFDLFISPDIVHEFSSVLAKKFKYPPHRILQLTQIIENNSIQIRPNNTIDLIKNWLADNRILECAITAHADYLVAGDTKHLLPLKHYKKTKIISARDFLELMK